MFELVEGDEIKNKSDFPKYIEENIKQDCSKEEHSTLMEVKSKNLERVEEEEGRKKRKEGQHQLCGQPGYEEAWQRYRSKWGPIQTKT